MTKEDCNTSTAPQVVSPPFTGEALPDLRANVTAAQAAGDLAYAIAAEAGWCLEDRADAYNSAFMDTMRGLGTPMACRCARCQSDPAEKQVGGWLMVAVQVR